MNRNTPSENALLASRRQNFSTVMAERLDVLRDFLERLGVPDAPRVADRAVSFVHAIDDWMKFQRIEAADRSWIHVRIAYFVGEYLAQKLGGHWFVEDTPGSRFFAHYVVGDFARGRVPKMRVDPFQVADVYLNDGPGRSLSRLLDDVEREIKVFGEGSTTN